MGRYERQEGFAANFIDIAVFAFLEIKRTQMQKMWQTVYKRIS